MNEFKLVITIGNDAMLDPSDVAERLHIVADLLEQGCVEGSIKDANGNTVGSFCFPDIEVQS
jgi:hypothetical protein